MPVWFIMCPASTKNGTASSGKLCDCVAICCTAIDTGIVSLNRKKLKLDMPIAIEIGMPMNIRTKNRMASSNMSVHPSWLCERSSSFDFSG